MVLNYIYHDFLKSIIFSKFVIFKKGVFLVKNDTKCTQGIVPKFCPYEYLSEVSP